MTEAADLNPLRKRIALATLQMDHVVKDQTADLKTYTYNYADLNSVMGVVKPPLAAQNIALFQPIVIRDGMMIVTTMLVDTTTGEWLMFDGPGFAPKADPQATGSAMTYYRRYALVSLFGLEADDDDAGMAHRAEAQPGHRTEAEAMIVAMVKALPTREDRDQFKADFKDHFGSTLSDLPESRHGDALTYAKSWPSVDDTATGDDTATADDAYEGAS